jgi:DnaJ-class molecular chaperone
MPICARCNGKGTLECPECEGRGVVEEEAQLELITETARSSDKCPVCTGKGIVACPDCEGSGEVDDGDD